MISKAKNEWYSELIDKNKNNPKKLWHSITKILHRNKTTTLPDHTSLGQLANSLGNFFIDKISKIMATFNSSSDSFISPTTTPPSLNSFTPVSVLEIKKIIAASPNKHCDLDPCPTILIRSCIDILAQPIASIVNFSLAEGSFPECFKNALVSPLLKKPSLPRNELKNYRPVSNLNYISKIVEKVVAHQINIHMSTHNLINPFQSAYRSGHSTETTLLAIQNDILLAMDKGRVTALTLLDLSAAFDTIDHSMLAKRLSEWFGLSGSALNWIKCYLTNRSQHIKVNGTLSKEFSLKYGVPQGSVLGPLLFSMYTAPLSSLISQFPVQHKLYADDTQIYLSFTTSEFDSKINTLQNCLNAVQSWMFSSKLKLNPDKTEFLLIGNNVQRNKFSSKFPVALLGQNVNPADSARNLGVIFDKSMSLKKHITNICNSCHFHIRDLKRIRKHVDIKVATGLANALVSSRIDYCNSLFYGASEELIIKICRVQNCLARTIMRSNKYTNAAPLLHRLHWLPVRSRIIYKICVITYKALNTGYPTYLRELLSFTDYDRVLRSCSNKKLHSGPLVRSNYGLNSFSSAAPYFWNQLDNTVCSSATINIFRKNLKTYLFRNTINFRKNTYQHKQYNIFNPP